MPKGTLLIWNFMLRWLIFKEWVSWNLRSNKDECLILNPQLIFCLSEIHLKFIIQSSFHSYYLAEGMLIQGCLMHYLANLLYSSKWQYPFNLEVYLSDTLLHLLIEITSNHLTLLHQYESVIKLLFKVIHEYLYPDLLIVEVSDRLFSFEIKPLHVFSLDLDLSFIEVPHLVNQGRFVSQLSHPLCEVLM